jgi:hypothetical protein
MNVGGLALLRNSSISFSRPAAALTTANSDVQFESLGQKRNYSARSIDSVMEEIRQVSRMILSRMKTFREPATCQEDMRTDHAEGKKKFIVQARIEIFEHPDVLEAAAQDKALLLGIESPQDRILEQLNKGFDTAKLRQAFKTFSRFPFYYHGYFIYGNVTETEDEMMQIPVLQRVGTRLHHLPKLRIEKYSPLGTGGSYARILHRR